MEPISRTMLELRKVESASAVRKIVSSWGFSFLLASAIWNSYSKSETARKPLTIVSTPLLLQYSASSPLKLVISTLSSPAVASRSSSIRSSVEKVGFLPELTSTATMTLPNILDARVIISKCPSVTGSKLPGQMTVLFIAYNPYV